MKFFLIFIITLSFGNGYAQMVTSPFISDHFQNAMLAAQRGQYAQVGGFKVAGSSIFMEQEFPGEVHIENNGVFNQGKFSYNIYNHQVIMNTGSEKGEIKSVVKYFKFTLPTDQVLTFVNTDSLQCKKKGYLLELVTGKNVNLYRYTYCKLVENPNFFSAEYRLFDANTEYFITVKGAAAKKIKIDRKSILKQLGGSEKIANYIDEQKIDFGKELEVGKIFAFANTL